MTVGLSGSGLSENELVCEGAPFLRARSARENNPSDAGVAETCGWGDKIKWEITELILGRRCASRSSFS